MAKAKATTREFSAVKRDGATVTVTTALTNEQAIEALGGKDGDTFQSKCAFEIHKLNAGFRCNEKMVAWGFIMADERVNPRAKRNAVSFDVKALGKVVRSRRPARFEVEGRSYEVGFCGPDSKHSGKFRITNGEKFGSPFNVFYGYIDTDGTWNPTRKAEEQNVADVVAKLTALIG